MADPLPPRFPRVPYLGGRQALRTLWKGVCMSLGSLARREAVWLSLCTGASPSSTVLQRAGLCGCLGALWCGPVPESSSLLADREAHSAEPRWLSPALPAPTFPSPLKGNGAHWDQPARVSGGGLGLCCYSKCREPELGAAAAVPQGKAGGWHPLRGAAAGN